MDLVAINNPHHQGRQTADTSMVRVKEMDRAMVAGGSGALGVEMVAGEDGVHEVWTREGSSVSSHHV